MPHHGMGTDSSARGPRGGRDIWVCAGRDTCAHVREPINDSNYHP